jgi:hypothetical protein
MGDPLSSKLAQGDNEPISAIQRVYLWSPDC